MNLVAFTVLRNRDFQPFRTGIGNKSPTLQKLFYFPLAASLALGVAVSPVSASETNTHTTEIG